MGRSRPTVTQPPEPAIKRAVNPPAPAFSLSSLLIGAACVAVAVGLLAVSLHKSGAGLQLAGGVGLGIDQPSPVDGSDSGPPRHPDIWSKSYALDLTRQPFVPDKKCPNVFVYRTQLAGLGHRMMGVGIAVAGALAANVALIMDREAYGGTRNVEEKDTYEFMEEFFHLDAFASVPSGSPWNSGSLDKPFYGAGHTSSDVALPWGSFKTAKVNLFIAQERARSGQSCSVAYEYGAGFVGCGPGTPDEMKVYEETRRFAMDVTGEAHALPEPAVLEHRRRRLTFYCACSYRVGGSFQNASVLMRPLFAAGNYSKRPVPLFAPAHSAAPRALTVAWHVRNGDIRLYENPGFYSNIAGALKRAAANASIPLVHVIFAQHEIKEDSHYGYKFLLTLPELAGATFPRPPLDEVLLHLVKADVLVHAGGSSFSYAASLASPESQIQISPPPKEVVLCGHGGSELIYFVDGTFAVGGDGAFLSHPVEAEEARLGERLQARYEEVTGRRGN